MPIVDRRSINNLIYSCRYNERYVLHVLRVKQKESKANLARETGLTAAAIGGIISSLEERGLVEVVGKVQGDMGQPATLYSLSREGAYGLGVSINRGHIETALINFVGEVVASRKHDCILPAPSVVLDMVNKDIKELVNAAALSNVERIAGVGVAQPFNFGSWGQGSLNWEEWDDFNLAVELEKSTGFKAYTQNDANAAAIAELIYGAGAESRDFVYLFFGSALVLSMGGAAVLDGECRNGATGNAGDVGLIPVPRGKIQVNENIDDSPTTYLTNRCSLNALVKYLCENGESINNRRDFKKSIKKNPKLVSIWIDDCLEGLVSAMCTIQALVDVPEIIIDCEDEDSDLVLRIIKSLELRLGSGEIHGIKIPKICKGSFGSNASAIGAATLPLDSSFSPKQKPL